MFKLKNLLTIGMNEIFPCLACYCQKLKLVVQKIEEKINTSPVKGNDKDEIENFFFFGSEMYDPF